mgnify:CR=1 FL=1
MNEDPYMDEPAAIAIGCFVILMVVAVVVILVSALYSCDHNPYREQMDEKAKAFWAMVVITAAVALPSFWGHYGPLVGWGILVLGDAIYEVSHALNNRK